MACRRPLIVPIGFSPMLPPASVTACFLCAAREKRSVS
jgi:hypothetical protein